MAETLLLALGEGLVFEQVVQEPQRFVVFVRSTTQLRVVPCVEISLASLIVSIVVMLPMVPVEDEPSNFT